MKEITNRYIAGGILVAMALGGCRDATVTQPMALGAVGSAASSRDKPAT